MTDPSRGPLPRSWVAVIAGLITVALAGCQLTPPAAPPPPDVRPDDYLIKVEDLPKDWRLSNDSAGGYRTQVCGVDLEPSPPAAMASVRFSMGPFGPFVQQYVRSYTDDTAERVITGLSGAVPGCTSFVATGTKGTKSETFRITPLKLDSAGSEVVSWRQVPESNPGLITDLAFFRRGDTMIAFLSYSIRDEPDPKVLEQAIAAVPK
ncbi:hypothetical protein [Microlunatus speluncae]|uniref:hypothetical protein n=1 Tax=Microlunatus speluncae TaxID=2594267 RepID=UPI00137637C4|nr:hypothetical protein [Microlunatus speluncae]